VLEIDGDSVRVLTANVPAAVSKLWFLHFFDSCLRERIQRVFFIDEFWV